ncbi:alpha-tectorin-like [Brienomyrus brachyistius]|uniref:alpha-tectorin-like n=1 Tax=Brienomyrus brachyistius TaxID=42636 RepID=UPI0020B2D333|nr:alpha-tectorin-like [Brienomyrus brachyistius]
MGCFWNLFLLQLMLLCIEITVQQVITNNQTNTSSGFHDELLLSAETGFAEEYEHFYPYGYSYGDTFLNSTENGTSPGIPLPGTFQFFENGYNSTFININGALTFDSPWIGYMPCQFPTYADRNIIAPFWAYFDTTFGGFVSYRGVTGGDILNQTTQDVNQYFPDVSFNATWAFIVTWYNVTYFNATGTATFQVTLISNENQSFFVMNYGRIDAPPGYEAGYDTNGSMYYFSVPGSLSDNSTELSNTSNTGISGRWVFRTDVPQGCETEGSFLPLGASFWNDSSCLERCTCTTSGLQCEGTPCLFNQTCQSVSFKYSCQDVVCPPNSHFDSNATACPATCFDPLSPYNCTLPPMENCTCDEGYVLDAGECMPVQQCGCTFQEQFYTVGETVLLGDDCGEQCTCTSSGMTCFNYSCESQKVCSVQGGQRGCYPENDRICTVGEYMYRTFDGLGFHYQGACGLTLTTFTNGTNLPDFVISTQKVPSGPQGNNFNSNLKFESNGTDVSVTLGNITTVQVNGQTVGLPFYGQFGMISLYHSSITSIVLETSFGVFIRTHSPWLVQVTIPSNFSGIFVGMCGNGNQDIEDELMTAGGYLANSTEEFGDSWRFGALSAFCVESINFENNTAGNVSQYLSNSSCGIMSLIDGPFGACSAFLNPTEMVNECIVAMTTSGGDHAVLCEALHNYALLCQQNGFPIGEWRNYTNCGLSCPPNSHYELCGTSCPATCPNLSFPFPCTQPCQEGCQCNDGFVLSGSQCLNPSACGCYYNGQYYQNGQSFWEGDGCLNYCTCNGDTGNTSCVPSSCSSLEYCQIVSGEYGCYPLPSGICYAVGDPHYFTFDGFMYDFQGTCRYVLASLCNDTSGLQDFQVEARNEPWMGMTVSITVEVFIMVYGYQVDIKSAEYGIVWVDGVSRSLPVSLNNGRVLINQNGAQTIVSVDFGLTVSYDGYYFAFIILPANYRGKTRGLCGNFNGDPFDDFISRSGELLGSASQFGDDWRVPGNYTCSSREPNNFCSDQTTIESMCQILHSAEGPFAFCNEYVDPEPYFNYCVYDGCVSANQDSVVCQIIQNYVAVCQAANARVYPWRGATGCEMVCPANSHYELCGSECGLSCGNSNFNATCTQSCTEGCFCDEGYFRQGSSCVPTEQCGCQFGGFSFKIGEKFWNDDCSQYCTCLSSQEVYCEAVACTPTQECTIRDGRLGCFDFDPLSTCTVSGDPHYYTFDGALAHFQGTCSYEITKTCGSNTTEGFQFQVVATNWHRGNNQVSFVSKVYVWMSQDGVQTNITIEQGGKVQVNGSDFPDYGLIGESTEVHEDHGFVVLDMPNNVMVRFDGRSTLFVRLGQNLRGSVCGMCGNFNGNPLDDKVSPDGVLLETDDEFGDSWKSNYSLPNCGATDKRGGGSEDDNCSLREDFNKACSIILNITGPFRICQFYIDPTPYFSSCVYDLSHNQWANGMLCSAVATYEAACNLLDLEIPEWRSDLLCPPEDPCAGLDCTEDEWCGENNGVYGCFCKEGNNSSDFDSEETCFSSSGTMSLSRCQLFEAGFPANILHLNDINCTAILQDGRLVFQFDNDGNKCGTIITSNGTHLIYQNTIYGETNPHTNIISRERRLVLQFYCAYPIEKSLSMPIGFHPLESVLDKILPGGIGEYRVQMTPFLDADFEKPVTAPSLNLPLNQRLFVGVEVIGMDERQISTVIDSCWATPDADQFNPIRWDLISHECPNPEDGTVVINQNGVSTTSKFSFSVFAFNSNSSMVYLHCQIHLCIKTQCNCATLCYPRYNARRRRSIEVRDTASISMPLVVSFTNSAPHFASSLLLLALPTLVAATVR